MFSAQKTGLANIGLRQLSLHGQQLMDGSLNALLVLHDLQLNDSRPGRETKITKFIGKRDRTDRPEQDNHLLEVDVRLSSDDEWSVNVHTASFDIILSLEFLSELTKLSSQQMNKVPSMVSKSDPQPWAIEGETITTTGQLPAKAAEIPARLKMKVVIQIDQPEFVLIEHVELATAMAMVFNVSVKILLIYASNL